MSGIAARLQVEKAPCHRRTLPTRAKRAEAPAGRPGAAVPINRSASISGTCAAALAVASSLKRSTPLRAIALQGMSSGPIRTSCLRRRPACPPDAICSAPSQIAVYIRGPSSRLRCRKRAVWIGVTPCHEIFPPQPATFKCFQLPLSCKVELIDTVNDHSSKSDRDGGNRVVSGRRQCPEADRHPAARAVPDPGPVPRMAPDARQDGADLDAHLASRARGSGQVVASPPARGDRSRIRWRQTCAGCPIPSPSPSASCRGSSCRCAARSRPCPSATAGGGSCATSSA